MQGRKMIWKSVLKESPDAPDRPASAARWAEQAFKDMLGVMNKGENIIPCKLLIGRGAAQRGAKTDEALANLHPKARMRALRLKNASVLSAGANTSRTEPNTT